MKRTIRRAKPEDSRPMYDAQQKSIKEICSKDYSEEHIKAWSSFEYNPNHWPETIKKDFVWGAEIDGEVQGMGHFNNQDEISVIQGLYFASKAIGLGQQMINEFFKYTKHKNLNKIVLSSTKTAKSFYGSFGFKQVAPDKLYTMRGMDILCHPMVKKLKS